VPLPPDGVTSKPATRLPVRQEEGKRRKFQNRQDPRHSTAVTASRWACFVVGSIAAAKARAGVIHPSGEPFRRSQAPTPTLSLMEPRWLLGCDDRIAIIDGTVLRSRRCARGSCISVVVVHGFDHRQEEM
jgi:hypothetical protein